MLLCRSLLYVTTRRVCLFSSSDSLPHQLSINAEFPAECDDEYWTINRDGLVEFNQPPSKPSFITAFNRQLILCDIMASALQLLYSPARSKGREQYEHQIVSELDSRLNKWMDQVPAHRMSCLSYSYLIVFRSEMGPDTRIQYICQPIRRYTHALPFGSNPNPPSVYSKVFTPFVFRCCGGCECCEILD